MSLPINYEKNRAWQKRSQQKARNAPQKKRKRIRAVSDKRTIQNADYSQIRREFLEHNRYCVPCHDGGWTKDAAEIHHKAGRDGERLCDASKFLAVCRDCHDWITANPVLAMQKGYSESRHRTT